MNIGFVSGLALPASKSCTCDADPIAYISLSLFMVRHTFSFRGDNFFVYFFKSKSKVIFE